MTSRIINGGQPTPDELRAHADSGVKTIINLRAPAEDMGYDEPAAAASLNVNYINLPITGAADLTRENVAEFSRQLDAARQRGNVLVHCGTSNRVGAMMALDQAWNRQAGKADAIKTGKQYGLAGLESDVEQLLDSQG